MNRIEDQNRREISRRIHHTRDTLRALHRHKRKLRFEYVPTAELPEFDVNALSLVFSSLRHHLRGRDLESLKPASVTPIRPGVDIE